MSKSLFIVEGVRTPFCKMGGEFANLTAADLGRAAVTSLLSRTGFDPSLIDEVIFGCVCQPADAANLSRVIALRSGIPDTVPAITVQRNCASGFEALTQASEKIEAERGEVFLVGGCESMTHVPLLFSETAARKFVALARSKSNAQRIRQMLKLRPSDFKPVSGLQLGLTDPVCGLNMGETVEVLGREFQISRQDQDRFAQHSHEKAVAAQDRISEEICPVYLTSGRGGPHCIERDDGPRTDSNIDGLSKLRPVFDRKTGTVTPGNSSQITDGAVALLVMTEEACHEHNLKPLGRLLGYHYAGCSPVYMGLGPIHAIDGAERKLGLGTKDADIIEINEAFAVQNLSVLKAVTSKEFCRKHLGREDALGEIDEGRLNVNGGAIALGHPVGATGARLALTALNELHRRKAKRALVSLCVGGGQGGALWLEAA